MLREKEESDLRNWVDHKAAWGLGNKWRTFLRATCSVLHCEAQGVGELSKQQSGAGAGGARRGLAEGINVGSQLTDNHESLRMSEDTRDRVQRRLTVKHRGGKRQPRDTRVLRKRTVFL